MSEHSFYWYDYETWGADPSRDKPCQFAGLRTDLDLNPVGEPLSIYCQPSDDFFPHPEACLITGITPQKALAEGLPEYQFIARVHNELARPGTCAVGYNSMRFDEEVTRFALYRNFYDPYAREYKNGNSRWDLIDVMRLAHALRPEGIAWPKREDGSPSFRLEALTAANEIEHAGAHDALADVRATIELARLLRARQPKLFEYALGLRDKQQVARQLNWRERRPLLHVSARYPASRGCAALVVPLAAHPVNRNSVIVCDLQGDPAPLLELDADAIRARVFSAADQLPAGSERIGLKEVHINRASIVAPAKMVDAAAAERLQIDLPRCRENWERLQTDTALGAKVQEVFKRREFAPLDDPERMLYSGGFFSNADRALIDRVRNSEPEHLAHAEWPFEDTRLPELLLRYRARNFPDSLTSAERADWEQWRRRRLADPEAGSALVAQAFEQRLEELCATTSEPAAQKLLADLKEYGAQLLEEKH